MMSTGSRIASFLYRNVMSIVVPMARTKTPFRIGYNPVVSLGATKPAARPWSNRNRSIFSTNPGTLPMGENDIVARVTETRAFSSDSSIEKEIEEKLEQLIRDEPVLLLLKGSPDAPQCGFSAAMVNILDKYKVLQNYAYVDVYSHELLRPCAKKITNWPTFPQLFINGKFVGGCDIVQELHETGELKTLLGTTTLDE